LGHCVRDCKHVLCVNERFFAIVQDRLLCYESQAATWQECAFSSALQPSELTVAVWDDKLYVLSGCRVSVYCVSSNKWHEKARMLHVRTEFSSVVFEDYTLGGFGDKGQEASYVDSYDRCAMCGNVRVKVVSGRCSALARV